MHLSFIKKKKKSMHLSQWRIISSLSCLAWTCVRISVMLFKCFCMCGFKIWLPIHGSVLYCYCKLGIIYYIAYCGLGLPIGHCGLNLMYFGYCLCWIYKIHAQEIFKIHEFEITMGNKKSWTASSLFLFFNCSNASEVFYIHLFII